MNKKPARKIQSKYPNGVTREYESFVRTCWKKYAHQNQIEASWIVVEHHKSELYMLTDMIQQTHKTHLTNTMRFFVLMWIHIIPGSNSGRHCSGGFIYNRCSLKMVSHRCNEQHRHTLTHIQTNSCCCIIAHQCYIEWSKENKRERAREYESEREQ